MNAAVGPFGDRNETNRASFPPGPRRGPLIKRQPEAALSAASRDPAWLAIVPLRLTGWPTTTKRSRPAPTSGRFGVTVKRTVARRTIVAPWTSSTRRTFVPRRRPWLIEAFSVRTREVCPARLPWIAAPFSRPRTTYRALGTCSRIVTELARTTWPARGDSTSVAGLGVARKPASAVRMLSSIVNAREVTFFVT